MGLEVAVDVVRRRELMVRGAPIVAPVLSPLYRLLRRWGRSELGQADRLGIPKVGLHGRHDDPSFDREDLDPDHRNPRPGIDDDAFVENDVQEFGQATRSGLSLHCWSGSRASVVGNCHDVLPLLVLVPRPLASRSLTAPWTSKVD